MQGGLSPLAWATIVWLATLTGALGQAILTRRPQLPAAALGEHEVVIVRPCAGAEPSLLANLVSLTRAKYTFRPRVRISMCSRDDPAWPIAQLAATRLRAAGIDTEICVVDPHGRNRKTCQLAATIDTAAQAIAMNFDSDVDLSGVDLDQLAHSLINGTCAAAWLMPVEAVAAQSRCLGDQASAGILGASLHAFALLSRLDHSGFVGKAFAVSTERLREVGGFAELVNILGEDTELARRLRARGYRVLPLGGRVVSTAQGRSFKSVYKRFSRWLMVVRTQRPGLLWTYPLFFLSTLVLLGLAAAVAWQQPVVGAILATWTLALRIATAVLAARFSQLHYTPLELVRAIGLGEVALWIAFWSSLGPREVIWRGNRLTVGRGGTLLPVEPASKPAELPSPQS